MKKSILLVSLFLAATALAGCSHPTDLMESASAAIGVTAQA